MSHRHVGILVCALVVISTSMIPLVSAAGSGHSSGPWLDEIDGVQVLHLIGTPYEMGFQHGSLLREEILQDQRAILATAEKLGHTQSQLLEAWDTARPFVPSALIEEMQGLADAVNVSLDQVAMVQMIPSFVHCSVFAAWDNATVDGRLYYARSFDFPLTIQDPESGVFVQDNAVLIVREPQDGHASLSLSIAGLIGSTGGFNDQGITTAVLSCWSNDETKAGTPMTFRQQTMLDEATSFSDALAILNTNRTEGWNFIVANTTRGVAVEQTANLSYQGSWDDPVEATRPFWPIPNVVRRTNLFISPQTAATQRERYNPRLLPILSYLTGKSKLGWFIVPAYLPWRHYQALSKSLESAWGSIDQNRSMQILRGVYNGSVDPVFHLFVALHLYCTIHQWVVCPATGEILISFAHGSANAWSQPIHRFTLDELRSHIPGGS